VIFVRFLTFELSSMNACNLLISGRLELDFGSGKGSEWGRLRGEGVGLLGVGTGEMADIRKARSVSGSGMSGRFGKGPSRLLKKHWRIQHLSLRG